MDNGICPVTGKPCMPAIAEAARIIATYKARAKKKADWTRKGLEPVIIFNSLVTAIVVFIVLLLTVDIGGEVFLIALIVALLPWLMYTAEKGAEDD